MKIQSGTEDLRVGTQRILGTNYDPVLAIAFNQNVAAIRELQALLARVTELEEK